MINLTEYIKICAVKKGSVSMRKLADRIGMTPQGLCNKLKANRFSSVELEKIAEAFGASLEIRFIDKQTGEPI